MADPQSPREFDDATVQALTAAGYSAEEAASILATLRDAGVIRSTIETTLAGINLVGNNARVRLTNGWEIFGRVTRDGKPLIDEHPPWLDLMRKDDETRR